MDYTRLIAIDKPYFSHEDVAAILGIKRCSAAVLCARYVKKGLFTRLKRDLYIRTEALAHLTIMDLFRIANLLQVPSYISLTTALSHHGVSSQVQRGFVESVCTKRSLTLDRAGTSFRYLKVKPALYGGFARDDGVFIASPEKAMLDALYLSSMGRYALDAASLDLEKLDRATLVGMTSHYPAKTMKLLERLYEETRRPREI
jgi:predicted transcriptional regulator of viral defense system